MNNILKNYYETKKAIDDLTKYLNVLKPQVVEIAKEGKVDTEFATFTVQTFTTYQYSDRVTQLANELSTLKKEELEGGIATVKSESVSPVMRVKKEEVSK